MLCSGMHMACIYAGVDMCHQPQRFTATVRGGGGECHRSTTKSVQLLPRAHTEGIRQRWFRVVGVRVVVDYATTQSVEKHSPVTGSRQASHTRLAHRKEARCVLSAGSHGRPTVAFGDKTTPTTLAARCSRGIYPPKHQHGAQGQAARRTRRPGHWAPPLPCACQQGNAAAPGVPAAAPPAPARHPPGRRCSVVVRAGHPQAPGACRQRRRQPCAQRLRKAADGLGAGSLGHLRAAAFGVGRGRR